MEQEERQELIFLQTAHVTQYMDEENGKSGWKVRKNISSEDLYELPKDWTEEQVFKTLDFAREFELIAWNTGIQFGKEQMYPILKDEREKAMKVIHDLENANNRLAEKLGQLIGDEEI